ncbi:MAG: rhodanese-related sulfurtransferase [Ahrensia sp.]|nr:rhodanese-related sulfurtransferase [Ahrensia sp.]
MTASHQSNTRWLVAALYKFVNLPDYVELQQPLSKKCNENGVLGTLLLAREGINGTITGPEAGLRNVLAWLTVQPRFADLDIKESWASEAPFYRMKVRLKREIVTLGAGDLNPSHNAGTYVDAQDWNELIADPDVVLVDTRNDYEVAIGSFKGAIDPKTASFRDFPKWVDDNLSDEKGKKVAMFCTGGIRCEKSTALLKSKGFDEVYHLKGGILKYLETVPEEDSLWHGECFVFDQRVSVGHGLQEGSYDLCHACRMPLSEDEKDSSDYQPGISCPHCADRQTFQQRERFEQRQKQIALAKQRGERHIASAANFSGRSPASSD